ncbi:MAG: hypothetical protein LBV04_01580 [Deferribacteraceae bacterium]|nr:hypothetical protein [Deferribacteraceae bacterium]
MKCKLLVLIVSMFLIVACSDDGDSGPHSGGGVPDRAFIDNEFAPFSLLDNDECTLVSVDRLDELLFTYGALRDDFDREEYTNYTIALCADNTSVDSYKQALIANGFNDPDDDSDGGNVYCPTIMGHYFEGIVKYVMYDGEYGDELYFYASEKPIRFMGAVDPEATSYPESQYMLVWAAWRGEYVDWDDVTIVPASS